MPPRHTPPLSAPLLTKEELKRLRAHERSIDDEAPFSDSGNPLIELTPDLASKLKRLESLDRDSAIVTAEARRIHLRSLHSTLMGKSQPLRIGLNGDLLPTVPSFDITIDSQLQPDGTTRDVAWIPVLLHLVPKPSSFKAKDGTTVPTLELGRSTFTDSYATASFFTTIEDPHSPGTFTRQTVSLRGFASISLHPKSPAEVHDALGNSDITNPFNSSPTSVSHPDESSRDLSTPAFTPSLGPQSPREASDLSDPKTAYTSPTRVIPGSAAHRLLSLSTSTPQPPNPPTPTTP